MRIPRRRLLEMLGATSVGSVLGACERRPPEATGPKGDPGTPAASAGPAPAPPRPIRTANLPGKAPDLIVLSDRPPNLEMPLSYLRHDLTPNDAFFVRWHLANLPTAPDAATFKLRIGGHVELPCEFGLAELEKLEPVEIVAVNQCSGNGRALATPRVPGVQWTHGAMGNARWRGARLRDLLARARPKTGALEIVLRGADQPPFPTVPPYVKSLAIDRAIDPDVIVAYAMNGAPLPVLNGFPFRLVVPGWYSTYWIKALEEITVLDHAFDGYWMAKAYRIPAGGRAHEAPDALAQDTLPIARMNVRSFLVPPTRPLIVGTATTLEGVAFDGGSGIARVELSGDDGASWREARLDPDLGKYSWRRFRVDWTPTRTGTTTLLSRATSIDGEVQDPEPRWNRSGYMRNVPEPLRLEVG